METSGFILALRSRLRRVLLIEGLSRIVAVALLACAAVVVVDFIWPMPGVLRLAALAAILVAVATIVQRRLRRPLSRAMDDHALASLAERRLPLLDGRLLSNIEGIALSDADRAALAANLNADAARALVPARALPRNLGVAFALIAATALVALLSPGFFHDAANRLFLPLGDAEWERSSELSGSLVRAVVPADEPLVVELRRTRGPQAPLRLAWEDVGHVKPGEYRTLDGLAGPWRQPLSLAPGRYALTALSGDARVLHLTGRVLARPQLAKALVTMTPPAYTGLEPQQLTTLTCTALPGSTLDFTLDFAMEADRVVEDPGLFLGQVKIETERLPHGLKGRLAVTKGGELIVHLADQDGIGPKPEPRFTVSLGEDRAPVVSLDGPRNNEAVTTRATVALKVEARDDYGLADLRLLLAVVAAAKPGSDDAGAAQTAGAERVLQTFPEVSGFATARPCRLGIGELGHVGEKLQLVGQASDANNVTGPGVGRSEVLALRVVSEDELRQELDRLLAEARDRVTQSREELSHGLAKPEQLAATSRNAQMAARKAGETLSQVVRRWRDNQLPAETLEPVAKADGLVNQDALPKLGDIPTAGAKADATARAADAVLGEAERLLAGLLQEGDLSRQLGNLLSREKSLAEESRAFVRDFLTKPLDDAAKTRQANLAERQKELADQMKDIEKRLLAGQSTQLAEAQDAVRKEQPADHLAQAGSKLATPDQRPQAPPHQEAAIAAMEKILALLRGGDAAKTLGARAGELAAEQEKLVKELEQGEPPKSLEPRQKQLAEDTKSLLGQVQEQGKNPEAAKSLAGANQSQQQAQGSMAKGESAGASREGAAAAAQLREAQKQLQGKDDEKKDPKDEKNKKSPDVLALLKELRTQQVKVVTDSSVIHQRLGEKPLDFAGKRDLATIDDLQGEILLRLNEEGIKELQQNPIAVVALRRVADTMARVVEHLTVPALGERGMRLEKTALYELTRLIEIAENLPKPDENQQGQGGDGGGNQAPFPPAAELALLATMEEELSQRTATGHPGDLAVQQKQLLDLVTLLEQGARPGSRPAVLLQRVDRAMSSSAYLLKTKDRGLTTRHEQEAATASLRRMLAELKGSGGDSKKPQQQQQKPQPGEDQKQAQKPQAKPSGAKAGQGPSSPSNAQKQDGQTAVVTEQQRGVLLMQLPPERREQLRQARDQNLPPSALKLYERYLEVLEEKP